MTNLTDKLNKGELPDGLYWVKHDGVINILDNLEISLTDVDEILAEVPSYEQWQAKLEENKRLKHDVGNLGYKIKNQRKEIERQIAQNTKLKELLKLNNVLDKGLKSILVWLKEDTQGEQKELCEQLYEDTLEMMSKIDQVLANNKIQANTVACNKIQENE